MTSVRRWKRFPTHRSCVELTLDSYLCQFLTVSLRVFCNGPVPTFSPFGIISASRGWACMRKWDVFSRNKPCTFVSLSIRIRFSSGFFQWVCTNSFVIWYYWRTSRISVYEAVGRFSFTNKARNKACTLSLSILIRFSSGFFQWACINVLST